MAEWLNAHAWKACLRKRNGGSNPPLSAERFGKSYVKQHSSFFIFVIRDENLLGFVPN